MHPDFIFFSDVNGEVIPSIVDPHGQFLDDSVVKLKGLSQFAERYGDKFHRIDAVIFDSDWKVLDLKLQAVRDAVMAHQGAASERYQSSIANKYL